MVVSSSDGYVPCVVPASFLKDEGFPQPYLRLSSILLKAAQAHTPGTQSLHISAHVFEGWYSELRPVFSSVFFQMGAGLSLGSSQEIERNIMLLVILTAIFELTVQRKDVSKRYVMRGALAAPTILYIERCHGPVPFSTTYSYFYD